MDYWREVPTLTGRHVTLRPLARGDRDEILAAFASGLEDVVATTVPNEGTIDAWYARAEAELAEGRALPFVVMGSGERIAGVTRFLRMAPSHRRVEIGGTVYAAWAQRTAVNTETKLLLLTHAFGPMDCQCVQIRTSWLNRRSRAAIERLGARQDGVLRGHRITPEGHIRDTVVYSILAHEWPGVGLNLESRLLPRPATDRTPGRDVPQGLGIG